MKQLTSFFNYSTDMVLATFLLLLIMFSFIVVASLTPITYPETVSDLSVLGAATDSQVRYTGTDDSSYELQEIRQSDSTTSVQFTLTPASETYVQELFVLEAPQDGTGLFRVEIELPDQARYGARYAIRVAGQEYELYNDTGDALQRDYELNVAAGETVPVSFMFSSEELINYPLDLLLSVEFTGLSTLP
ncbi:MAG: hypothetical protein TR69_WS6001000142 [candidate division WS6 bacterium OLB20]|uniref:Uncharacterized protein n=1 Tax=candidate division WS6 bacterium OLB20 TaxID=1617426 RepID=A0A136M038_9BACT|nr:MAG: hypothetical protein TR69_WS6001000142 [candidate division WS6 bacterium OLB20]